ncbi:hypothetical protein PV327_010447 [Microctonus hyperodae]|uniref:RING-type domain-containing protein n=1 Tax=Microctonus hyperodae TaxID=165561 RepID=A0AA39FSJ9_MICHY|nr:hypothetical protein PV327_010447 [Microctonus hyperodae]
MACEACATKFTLFKRKKQCKDCLRFYCTDCVIRRGDRVLSCGNCSMLSRRPLIRSQVLQMKSKDLKQYLIAKKVSLRGCVEKEDLVNILMQFANGTESQTNNERTENIPESTTRLQGQLNSSQPSSSPRRSRSPPINLRQTVETVESPQSEHEPTPPFSPPPPLNHDVQIEEVNVEEEANNVQGPEPLITEQDEDSTSQEQINLPSTNDNENCVDNSLPVLTEIPTWTGNVKITDINERSDLEYLNVKQLKDLLRSNRIDFRGCVERSELLDRATRLWDAHNQSREDLDGEGVYEESLCKICWDSPIECVILECGHMACCINCGKQMNECPICRQYVVRVVRFFKA